MVFSALDKGKDMVAKIVKQGIALWFTLIMGMELTYGAQYEAGVHYFELPTPVAISGDGVEVTEYFSYMCGHCYQFEPVLAAWVERLPEDVVFDRTPAIWNKPYQQMAQVYYTLKAMNVLDKMHLEVFNAIHLKRMNLQDPSKIADLLADNGIDGVAFGKVFASFGVRASLQQAEARGRAYQATGVPSLIVNGKYRIDAGAAGSTQAMLAIADYLIELERP